MKTRTLFPSLALASVAALAFPVIALAESPDDSSPSKQGVTGNREATQKTTTVTTDKSSAMASREGIARRTDAVYIYRAGTPVKVIERTVVTEGITVEPNGRVVWANGKEMMLTEGQMVGFDGTLLEEPMPATPDRGAVQGSAGAKD